LIKPGSPAGRDQNAFYQARAYQEENKHHGAEH
jgi:hypothetical protein